MLPTMLSLLKSALLVFKRHQLRRNYHSSQNILKLASEVINKSSRTASAGLGPKTLKSVEQWAFDQKISFYQALQKVSKEEISHKNLGITYKAKNSTLESCKFQEDPVRLSETNYASKLIQEVIDRMLIGLLSLWNLRRILMADQLH